MEIWKDLRGILLLPAMGAVVIPAVLLFLTGLDTFRAVGIDPGAANGSGRPRRRVDCPGPRADGGDNSLFGTVGRGTLAPWNLPQHLVVRGVYRHVQNPMISGAFSVLLDEALLAAFPPLFGWLAIFVIANRAHIPWFKEPGFGPAFWRAARTARPALNHRYQTVDPLKRCSPVAAAADEAP